LTIETLMKVQQEEVGNVDIILCTR